MVQQKNYKKMKPERLKQLEQKVWDNLKSSNLLKQILDKSCHACDESDYERVKFWAEIGGDKMYLQIFIKDKRAGVQPVTPKLYRITESEEEQRKLSGLIWSETTLDDILYISSLKADEFHERDQKSWLNPIQSAAIKKLYHAIKTGRVNIELVSGYAQYDISLKH